MRKYIAFICDLVVGLALVSFLNSFERFRAVGDGLLGVLVSGTGNHQLAHNLTLFFLILILTTIYRMHANLIFGVSLSELFLGLKGQTTFIWNRIGGGMRALLEMLTMPLIIFQLPKFFGKRSLCEMVTSTQVKTHFNRLGLFTGVVWFVLSCVLFFYAPFLENLAGLDALKLKVQESSEINKEEDNFNGQNLYRSNKLRFSVMSDLEKGRYDLIPSFDITKVGKKKHIKPSMVIFDNRNLTVGVLKVDKSLSLLSLLRKVKYRDPFFAKSYPALNQALEEKNQDKYFRRKFEITDAEKILSPEQIDDIFRLIKLSMSVTPKKSLQFFKEHGPFIRSVLYLKKRILELAPAGDIEAISYQRLGDSYFFKISQTKLDQIIETFIPVETDNSFVMQFSWAKTNRVEITAKEFKEMFFANSKWYFDYKDIYHPPKRPEQFTPWALFDFMMDKKVNGESLKAMQSYLESYYKEMTIKSIDRDTELLRVTIVNAIDRMITIINSVRKEQLKDSVQTLNHYKKAIARNTVEGL